MARRRHLLVLFSHDVLHRLGPISTYWPHAHGAAGVDVFFAISGILICTLLLGEERQTGTISLRGFYIRRAFRILPAPFVYVAVVAILSALHVLTSVHKSELVSSPLFCRNIQFLVTPGWYTGHFWSLSNQLLGFSDFRLGALFIAAGMAVALQQDETRCSGT